MRTCAAAPLAAASRRALALRGRDRPADRARSAVSARTARDGANPLRPLGRRAQRLALGFDALAADVYWIRAHSALRRRSPCAASGRGKYELLYPLLDLTTTLDPYFTIAYRFGAIFLSEAYPGGPGRPIRRCAAARRASRRSRRSGSTTTTSRSSITGTCGITRRAAQWFRRAAEQPSAQLAAAARGVDADARAENARGALRYGSRSCSRIRTWLRGPPQRGLLQLDALDAIDQLEADRRPRFRRRPASPYSWEALVRRGILSGIPRRSRRARRSTSIPRPAT